jgi:predicted porin
MKKSLLALAVLGAYAGVASAQSSVTIFGVVDLSVNQIKNGDAKTTSMQSNQLNSNRLGFRGFEDMGGGLGAGFWLEAGMNNEGGNVGGANGSAGSAPAAGINAPGNGQSTFFNRRSTVSLVSQAGGEIRLGRDYTPSFWNLAYFDVFGANGIANSTSLVQLANPVGQASTTGVRANNTVGYLLPGNLGGFYGQIQYALGQGNDNNKYWGARGGFAAGPFDFALGYGETDTANADKFKVVNLGGSWNFGFAKFFALVQQAKFSSLKQDFWELSVGVPLGQGEFRAMYGSVDDKGTLGAFNFNNTDATVWGLQYIYNLSKRTAIYGGYSSLDNDPGSARSVLPGTAAANLAGNTSSGFNVGVRHSF